MHGLIAPSPSNVSTVNVCTSSLQQCNSCPWWPRVGWDDLSAYEREMLAEAEGEDSG